MDKAKRMKALEGYRDFLDVYLNRPMNAQEQQIFDDCADCKISFEAYKDKCDVAKNATCRGDSVFERTQSLLGDVLFVCVDPNNAWGQQIANLFAQHGFGYDGKCYTDYSALQKCLNTLNQYAKGKSVAIPYMMSCYRGGGDWDVVSTMIIDTLKDCDVTFYRYSE